MIASRDPKIANVTAKYTGGGQTSFRIDAIDFRWCFNDEERYAR